MRCCARRRWRRIWAKIDQDARTTHLALMGIEITISPEGQIVLAEDVRDALGLKAGERLSLERVGNRLILDAPEPEREGISYEEFRRRVPKYEGPRVAIEDMRIDWDYFAKHYGEFDDDK